MILKIKKLHENAVIPQLATIGAACVDLVATDMQLLAHDLVLVKLGFATAIPEGYKAVIVPRSSFTKHEWIIQNSPAQIDSDYRGEWMLKFRALPVTVDIKDKQIVGYTDFPYQIGDRVAQMYLEKVVDYTFEEVEDLSITERADGGFGSTGK